MNIKAPAIAIHQLWFWLNQSCLKILLITSYLGLVWLHSKTPQSIWVGKIEVGNELIFLPNKPLCGVEHHVLAYYVGKTEFPAYSHLNETILWKLWTVLVLLLLFSFLCNASLAFEIHERHVVVANSYCGSSHALKCMEYLIKIVLLHVIVYLNSINWKLSSVDQCQNRSIWHM